MAEPTAEARIRDLERRLDMDSGSRLFVALAEEYRKLHRFKDALSALQKGLLAHPGYVAAQVALGRVYLEAGQTTDAIATFSKVLVADPGNLVAAKSLADVQHARGEKLEALKKYKLYRALSGDRKVDEIIADLEAQVTPKPVAPPRASAPPEPLPPPPSFQDTDKGRGRAMSRSVLPSPAAMADDPFDVTSVAFEPLEDSGKSPVPEGPFLVPTRDLSLGGSHSDAGPASDDVVTRMVRLPEPLLPPPAAEAVPGERAAEAPSMARPPEVPAPAAEPEPWERPIAEAEMAELPEPDPAADEPFAALPEEAAPARPSGRALADLYYSQGHYAEALQIYDDLVSRHPFDGDLQRLRRESEARLLPAGETAKVPEAGPKPVPPPPGDPALDRRRARIRVLQRWLGQVQAR